MARHGATSVTRSGGRVEATIRQLGAAGVIFIIYESHDESERTPERMARIFESANKLRDKAINYKDKSNVSRLFN